MRVQRHKYMTGSLLRHDLIYLGVFASVMTGSAATALGVNLENTVMWSFMGARAKSYLTYAGNTLG